MGIKSFITGLLILFASICPSASTNSTKPPVDIPITYQISSEHDSLKQELVQAVDNYIHTKFPKSKLTGQSVVSTCLDYDFDICFALAQAEIESGLGTAGKGARTNNPWNVGAWDSRSASTMNKLGYGYSHPDQSLEPYIILVQTKYLGNKRTIQDLMRNYVSLSGHRYAGAGGYELMLRKSYNIISTKTTIKELQQKISTLS